MKEYYGYKFSLVQAFYEDELYPLGIYNGDEMVGFLLYNQVSIKLYVTPEYLIERSKWTHIYVVCDNYKIIGCGSIGPYWGKEDESSLFTIFVLPEYQGKGIGRKIIETLENDEIFMRSKRIEIPASITACQFYSKMGYNYKNGIEIIDEEQLYRLEKFR